MGSTYTGFLSLLFKNESTFRWHQNTKRETIFIRALIEQSDLRQLTRSYRERCSSYFEAETNGTEQLEANFIPQYNKVSHDTKGPLSIEFVVDSIS